MSKSTTADMYDERACAEPASLWPTLLAAGSALLVGYVAGRITFAADVRRAVRRIEDSPEPIESSIGTL